MTNSPYGELAAPVPPLPADLDLPDRIEEPALEAAHAAGTPLSAVATEDDGEDQGRQLERLDAHVELADGTTWDVRILNRDFVAWDLTRAKRKWPAAEEAAFLLNNYLTWTASKRNGHPVGTFEAFVDAADVVKLTRADAARPTRSGAGPASS